MYGSCRSGGNSELDEAVSSAMCSAESLFPSPTDSSHDQATQSWTPRSQAGEEQRTIKVRLVPGEGLGPLSSRLLLAGLLEMPVALLPWGLVLLLAVGDGLSFGPAQQPHALSQCTGVATSLGQACKPGLVAERVLKLMRAKTRISGT